MLTAGLPGCSIKFTRTFVVALKSLLAPAQMVHIVPGTCRWSGAASVQRDHAIVCIIMKREKAVSSMPQDHRAAEGTGIGAAPL